ncbi:hypothetical protein CLAIMM_01276 [Cladophialophora immunda]|nr:hypothetical protein CLAIMM_01276 [Cladophialophora immunda]
MVFAMDPLRTSGWKTLPSRCDMFLAEKKRSVQSVLVQLMALDLDLHDIRGWESGSEDPNAKFLVSKACQRGSDDLTVILDYGASSPAYEGHFQGEFCRMLGKLILLSSVPNGNRRSTSECMQTGNAINGRPDSSGKKVSQGELVVPGC